MSNNDSRIPPAPGGNTEGSSPQKSSTTLFHGGAITLVVGQSISAGSYCYVSEVDGRLHPTHKGRSYDGPLYIVDEDVERDDEVGRRANGSDNLVKVWSQAEGPIASLPTTLIAGNTIHAGHAAHINQTDGKIYDGHPVASRPDSLVFVRNEVRRNDVLTRIGTTNMYDKLPPSARTLSSLADEKYAANDDIEKFGKPGYTSLKLAEKFIDAEHRKLMLQTEAAINIGIGLMMRRSRMTRATIYADDITAFNRDFKVETLDLGGGAYEIRVVPR